MPLWWTKRSLPPPSGVTKPKPLSSLNHLTTPVAICLCPPWDAVLRTREDAHEATDCGRWHFICRTVLARPNGESLASLGGGTPRLGPGHEASGVLVVELEARRLDPVPEAQDRHVVEDRVVVVGALEVVVRDPGAEVMDVVEADVAG